MGNRRSLKVEGVIYLYKLRSISQKHAARDAIETALSSSKCGRIIASGTSFYDEGSYSIEFVTSAREKAEETISRVCTRKRLDDYEVVWN